MSVEGKGMLKARGHDPFGGRGGCLLSFGFEGGGRVGHLWYRASGRWWCGAYLSAIKAALDYFLNAGLDLVDRCVVADGHDSLGFAGGNLFVFFVDAAVEVVRLAFEAVLVGALFFDVALIAATCAAERGFEGR